MKEEVERIKKLVGIDHNKWEQPCTCDKCKNMCKVPCIGTPKDIEAIIDAGYADRLKETMWMVGYLAVKEKPIAMIQPTEKDGWCAFRQPDGLCELHDRGLKPTEGECPNIVVFGTYMDIRVPLTKKWKKIINERGDKPNTYHNCLISYISEQIALSGFNMKSIGNLLIKGIVFNQNDYYKYNDVGGFPATINDLGYWDKNRVEPNEDFHTVRLFNTVSVYGLMFGPIKQNNFITLENDIMQINVGSITYI